ncbi:helix-turn-helix transcriptional regulator [Bacillus spongiae]|uniref:Helix-turn-helix transcriptional regulator n=1 Tax=Bacillus spongiae TaxID=2683610 RepID=A0ABU8H8K2_9BACI
MFGLGKKRSTFGRWLDKKGLTQDEVAKCSKVGRTTISNMCNDEDYSPRIATWVKVQRALERKGYTVDRNDFFNM